MDGAKMAHVGTVTLWSPNSSQPHVKMLCHKGPVQSLAVDPSGRYMATAGLDGKLKIWDIRKYEPLQEYYSPRPATSLSISQRGLLGVGWTSHVTVRARERTCMYVYVSVWIFIVCPIRFGRMHSEPSSNHLI